MSVFNFLNASNFYGDSVMIYIVENGTEYTLNNKNDIPDFLKNRVIKDIEFYTNIEDYNCTVLEVWITVK